MMCPGLEAPQVPSPGTSRWSRATLRAVLVLFALGAAGLTAIAAAAWDAAAASAAIQSGPRAVAKVVSVHVTSVSGRAGRQYTSHYRVVFSTQSGERITTSVPANGDDPCSCTRTLIAYDPARPDHAELAGDPLHTYGEALAVSGVAAGVVLSEVLLAVGWRRLRRQSSAGVAPPSRRRRRRLPLAAPRLGLVAGIGVGAVFAFAGGSSPSVSLAHQVVARAAAGQGTTDCLALAPASPAFLPVNATWANDALDVALGTPVPSSSAGYPHWDPAKDAFEPLLEPTFLAFGGGTPPPGQPSSVYEAWIGAGNTPGSRAVDIWALSSPVAAGRFADAYLASLCYTFAHHSAVPARTVAPPSPSPPGETCVVTGLPEHPAGAAAWCVLPIGRYVVRGETTGTSAAPAATVPIAAAIVARAVAGGAAAPAH